MFDKEIKLQVSQIRSNSYRDFVNSAVEMYIDSECYNTKSIYTNKQHIEDEQQENTSVQYQNKENIKDEIQITNSVSSKRNVDIENIKTQPCITYSNKKDISSIQDRPNKTIYATNK